MIARYAIPAFAMLAGLAIAAAVPSIPQTARRVAGLQPAGAIGTRPEAAAPKTDAHGAGEEHAEEGKIAMTTEQVTAAGIQTVAVSPGVLTSHVAVPGVLAANQDRLTRVTARVPGTVAEVRKKLGDAVVRGDVLAVIESREIADAKGEFLAATRTLALAETTLNREARLWKQRISAEQDFLQARSTAEEVRIRLDLSRQRLSTLGLSDAEVAGLPRQPVASLRRLEIRAPIDGQVTARAAVPGAAVTGDAELFSVADLSALWVEMAIPPRDLPMARKGQAIAVAGDGIKGEGHIVFLSPLLDPETRSARAVAELPNAEGQWRPGAFVSANLATAEQPVNVMVPREALQEVEKDQVVFVRTPDGFEKREIALGREGTDAVEVIFGLDAGTEIAVAGSFALKAELGKSEAGHGH